jgi:hypothetical protein
LGSGRAVLQDAGKPLPKLAHLTASSQVERLLELSA